MLNLTPTQDNRFTLTADFKIYDITIPKGYTTNGANIPRFLWCFYPPFKPQYLASVILHDYLCDVADGTIPSGVKCTFKQADTALKESLKAQGASSFTANAFYLACRAYHILKYGKVIKE